LSTDKIVQERRNSLRIECQIPLKLCQEDGDIVTETGNISRSGVYCRVNRYIAPMSKVQAHLLLPVRKRNGKTETKKVTCQGVIVRTEQYSKDEKYNIAIFFNEIAQKDSEAIADYIQRQYEKQQSLYN
jgi:hypothetical protein